MFKKFKTAPLSVRLSLLTVVYFYGTAVYIDPEYTLFLTAIVLFLVACIRLLLFYLNDV